VIRPVEEHFEVGRLFQGRLLSLASREIGSSKGRGKTAVAIHVSSRQESRPCQVATVCLSVDKFGAKSSRLTARWNCIPEDVEHGQKLTVLAVHFGRGLLATQLICETLQPIGRFGSKTAAKERFPKAFQCLPD
jgi:hypothetical protein